MNFKSATVCVLEIPSSNPITCKNNSEKWLTTIHQIRLARNIVSGLGPTGSVPGGWS
ncbi:hypothetical protein HanIR_Chr09g0412551 [Helianthus annuus]|nr:hypothetical protein HanIR_Chr09g0412551 [Helianthus annuus]